MADNTNPQREDETSAKEKIVQPTDTSESPEKSPHLLDEIAKLKYQLLMKEIDIRNAEINIRTPSQMQLIASQAVLFGGLAALAGFLFGQAKLLPIIPYAIFFCLIYSIIALTFLWTNLDHDIRMAVNGNYVDDIVRSQLCKILGVDANNENFFSWGYYRIHKSRRFMYANIDKAKPWWKLSFLIIGIARYIFMLLLAVIFFIAAIVIAIQQGVSGFLLVIIIVCYISTFIYGFLACWFASHFREAIEEEKSRIFGQQSASEHISLWKRLRTRLNR